MNSFIPVPWSIILRNVIKSYRSGFSNIRKPWYNSPLMGQMV